MIKGELPEFVKEKIREMNIIELKRQIRYSKENSDTEAEKYAKKILKERRKQC